VPGGREGASKVHTYPHVPVFDAHIHDHPVAHDAGVVHEQVQVTEGVDRLPDETLCAISVGDVIPVGDGLAAGPTDLGGHVLGGLRGATGTVHVAAKVVDDYFRSFASELHGVCSADAVPGPRHDDNSPFTTSCHSWIPSSAFERRPAAPSHDRHAWPSPLCSNLMLELLRQVALVRGTKQPLRQRHG
jgi:hypothetical protein